MWDFIHLFKKSGQLIKLSVFESLFENSFIHLLTFFSSLSLHLPGFSLQDSFEYINQDPNLGKLNTNQNNLGPCRTGSNLGKINHMNGFILSEYHCGGCVFCFIWVCCGVLFLFALSLICVYFFVLPRLPSSVCLCPQVCCRRAAASCCRGWRKEDLSGSPAVLLSLQVCVECWVQCDPHT